MIGYEKNQLGDPWNGGKYESKKTLKFHILS